MGFGTLKTLQVQMIAYVFQLIFVLIATIGSTYIKNTRTLWMIFDMAFAIAGSAMVREIHGNKWGRFFGYCLTMGYTPNLPIILSMLSANIGGFSKKMTVNAMVSVRLSKLKLIFIPDVCPEEPELTSTGTAVYCLLRW